MGPVRVAASGSGWPAFEVTYCCLTGDGGRYMDPTRRSRLP